MTSSSDLFAVHAPTGERDTHVVLVPPAEGYEAQPVCIVSFLESPPGMSLSAPELAGLICHYIAQEARKTYSTVAPPADRVDPRDLNPPPPRAEEPFEDGAE